MLGTKPVSRSRDALALVAVLAVALVVRVVSLATIPGNLMLDEADNAQEVLAAALVVYPRSRPLRSLYYVASAVAALDKGEVMLATSQLETALAHYDGCVEASKILDYLVRHHHEVRDPADIRSMFG